MGVEIQLFEVWSWRLQILHFCLWGRLKSEVYRKKVNTREVLVARIMNRAALLKQERQDGLRKATRTIAKRGENCIEVDGGILNTYFELLQFIEIIYVTNKCNQYVFCSFFSFG